MNDLKIHVINEIKKLSMWEVDSNELQWVVRCPYCGDSKNTNHGHFSIRIDITDDSPMVYNCFKCADNSGLITSSILEDLGIHLNYSNNESLKKLNKTASKSKSSFKLILNPLDIPKRVVPLYTSTKKNDEKKHYLENRLGISLSYSDLKDIKCILSLSEFLAINEINDLTVKPYWANVLETNYIGFLSFSNNKIIFRNICNDDNLRYFKYTIDPRLVIQNNFYSIPNSFDIMYTDDVHIHASEGIFDILSIYFNMNMMNKTNNYYFAVCGFGYRSVLDTALYMGLNTGVNFHIWSDNDKKDYEYNKFQYYSSNEWVDKYHIHRNTYQNEKDFGVPYDRIKEIKYELKFDKK